jgi:hypothetical protein
VAIIQLYCPVQPMEAHRKFGWFHVTLGMSKRRRDLGSVVLTVGYLINGVKSMVDHKIASMSDISTNEPIKQ